MERAWAALLQYDTPEVQDFAYRILIGGIITGIAHMVGFIPTREQAGICIAKCVTKTTRAVLCVVK